MWEGHVDEAELALETAGDLLTSSARWAHGHQQEHVLATQCLHVYIALNNNNVVFLHK